MSMILAVIAADKNRCILPEPSHVIWVVEHESYCRLFFLGLERLPSKNHALYNDSVGVHGQDAANKSGV